ncbi:MAG: RloB family protein [Prosthecobacter sp.]|uniref:RloB family protein n=1 Tax=Prosthecobacter sp. TaxID=1965333 RepID=UPI0039035625
MRGRRAGFKKTKRLYVIPMEGAVTEPIYFSEFHPGRDGGFRLKLLGNPNHKSRPLDVLQRLIDYERRERPGPNTEYWAVIDRDAWSAAELDEVSREIAKREDYHLALSNPCFELWLWLHLKPNRPFADRHDCQRSFCREWPEFAKGDYDAALLMPHVLRACESAKELNMTPDAKWPVEQASWVYRLVEKLR